MQHGAKFHRTCRGCKRKIEASGLAPERQREMAQGFAAAHLEHFEAKEPGRSPFRCAADGTLLLWDWACPEHVFTAERVLWTPEMASAYKSVIEGLASGKHVSVPQGAMFLVQRAYGLARAWGMRKDVWLREGVA